jgi:N-acetylmuramoyl-L-alanine amidase
LRPGASGAAVLAVQKQLGELGYWLGTPDGTYGALTSQAVIALQKAAGLRRDGVLGPRTRAALTAGTRPTARTRSGNAIEVDLDRQLLLVVVRGKVTRILNTSTGSGVHYRAPDGEMAHATTPSGSFKVAWVIDEWHTSPLGELYRPRYFHPRGIAVHGAPSVPAYPASHGCVRVSVAAMDMIWQENLMPMGSTVLLY